VDGVAIGKPMSGAVSPDVTTATAAAVTATSWGAVKAAFGDQATRARAPVVDR
jgi:hypothetical protein